MLFEAPNWALDGTKLVLNGDGKLWSLDVSGGGPVAVPLSGVPELNNDHVLAPDGEGVFLSANDGHIYRASLDGGPAIRITEDDGSFHFLHGVSPDGNELAYVGIEAGDFTRPGRGLDRSPPYMATFRWPRYPQRQQLVAGFRTLCICGVPAH